MPSNFFSSRFVSVQVVHPYSSIDTTAAGKKLRFILSVWSDFHMIHSLSIAVHAFVSRVSMSFSVDETLLPRSVNLSTSFREVPSSVEMSPVWLKHIYSVLCALTWRPMLAAITQECCEQCWISPGGNTPQSTNYTATCLPSRKLSKLDEPDTQDTAEEAGTSS